MQFGTLDRGVSALALVMLLAGSCAPAAVAAQPVVSQQAQAIPSDDEIRRLLAERMEGNGVGIVAGVIGPGRRSIIAHGRSGAADDRPLDGDTVFQIGSVTKGFTTLLLAEMVVRGEVGLDDPASLYLPPGVTLAERGRPITLRDLATHMSGLPSMPTNLSLDGEPDPYEAYSVEQLHHFLSTYDLPREPGARWGYSNLGVTLLGRLLARRAGMEYEALLRQRILDPLGMNDTSIRLRPDQERRLAPGHDRYLRPVRTWEMLNMPASGSLRSTANDLMKFVVAYLEPERTPLAAAIALQLRERVPLPPGWQALGWAITRENMVSHAGGKQGYRSGVAFDPATGRGIVVLANARTDDQPIGIALHLLAGRPLPAAPDAPRNSIVAVDRATLDGYAGRYRLADGRILELARKDSHLLVHRPGNGISEFFPTGPRDFFLDTGNDELSFQLDAEGRITGLVLYGDGRGGEGMPATRLD
ncbi:serine hydrolase [Sphingosinicella sp. CPCC 101087]|uniref:serine hydrolase n=1 Tax=Sphingosinicella sp. CPCC 101087 TaxID=2497754 RepID=UPI0013E9DE77|nr:serine hydrolase [Sphingosinicella sp. CPCC 101087]